MCFVEGFFVRHTYDLYCRHVEGHTLALQHSGQTTFSLCLVKRVIVMLRCAVNVGTYFQYFP